MKEVNFSDHEMAAWLRGQDPNWTFASMGNITKYFSKGKLIAKGLFVNSYPCSRKFYIKE